jgi:hypothetical protein
LTLIFNIDMVLQVQLEVVVMNQSVRRKALWDLPDYQCPVIGTCLTMGELRKLARKLKLDLSRFDSDFELHAHFVHHCKAKNTLSRLVQKMLEKKFRRVVWRFSKAKDPETLLEMWNASASEADIPGPFWAVMTHPMADAKVVNAAFGEVHMLSHLVGAANRADIRLLKQQESDLEALRHENEALRKNIGALRSLHQDEKHSLDTAVSRLRREKQRLTELLAQSQATEALRRIQELEGLRSMLESKAIQLTEDLEEAQQDARRNRTEAKTLQGRMAHLEHELQCRQAEVGSLEETLGRVLATDAMCSQCDQEQCPRLCGKCILYVGGRANMVQHYRALVESSGGEFIHHDGGDEASICALTGALCQADCVFFPVDCVSHEASLHVKRTCKSWNKPFVALRSSGLSSLARGLTELAA